MGMLVKALAANALLGVAGAAVILYALDSEGITPRTLGPYLEQRTRQHNPVIEDAGRAANAFLTRLDRGEPAPRTPAPWRIGAQDSSATAANPASAVTTAAPIAVAGVEQLQRAIAAANPGDTIVLLPGTYRIAGRGLKLTRSGREGAPITLRGSPGARIESAAVAAMTVQGAWWRIEHLDIAGVCRTDSACEHAFHVVGGAHHFAAVGNRVSNFNAHFKINGQGGRFPDHGLIDANTLDNSRARKTANPVAPIDLVAASGWTIRRNLISDFVKDGGNRVSYGAFAKGAGSDNLFERNIVICEWKLQGAPGERVGLSLGGGGTGKGVCRERACVVEQERGILRDNLVAACSDVGIYLNNAAASSVLHNTLVDTAGVGVRFAGSSAQVEGNLVDGAIRSRDGGVLRAIDNLDTSVAAQYLGRRPWRALFRAPESLDFNWISEAPRRDPGVASRVAARVDLCGAQRPAAPRYGAFEDFKACELAP